MNHSHPLPDVVEHQIDEDTKNWQFAVAPQGTMIDQNYNICLQNLIEGDIAPNDNITAKSSVQLWRGIRIGNNAFISTNATFTNDLLLHSKVYSERFPGISIKNQASTKTNTTLLPDITTDIYAMVGATAVTTKNTPNHPAVASNTAKTIRHINNNQGKQKAMSHHILDRQTDRLNNFSLRAAA